SLGDDLSDHSGVQVVLDGLTNLTTFTDAAGDFSFNGAVPGNYQITLSKNGFKLRNLVVTLPADDARYVLPYTVEMTLSYGILKGQVTLENATDHSGTAVNLAGTSYSAFTDSAGNWAMSIPEGSYSGGLQVSQSGYVGASDSTTLTIGAKNAVVVDTIMLNHLTGSISGLVQDSAGKALAGVQLTDTLSGTTTLSNSDGSFTISQVAVGSHDLALTLSGYVTEVVAVTVTSGATTDLSATPLQLTPFSFSGSVSLGDDLSDHSGVQVVLDGSSNLTTNTQADGSFNFSGAVPGNYQLTFSRNGFSSQTLSISIASDATSYILPYSITLSRLEGVVKGVVSLSDQLGHSGVLVEVVGTTFTATTNALGEWSMKIPVGNYSDGIRYQKAYYQSALTPETFTVTDYGDHVAPAVNLVQISAQVSFNATAMGTCSEISVHLSGTKGAAVGYSARFIVNQQGNLPATELPLGDYTVTVACAVNGWESYTFDTSLSSGVLALTLDAVTLRQSFVNINEQDIYTNNGLVTLSIGNTDALEMKIEEGIHQGEWIAFSEYYNHTLSAGDGTKTVTVRFRDIGGVELSSVQDSIKLDTSLNAVSFMTSGASTKGDLLHFALDLDGELEAKVSATVNGLITGLPLLDNGFGGDTTAQDGIYERDYLIGSALDINQPASAFVTDVAGNTLTLNS
ncbi:MAG: carboxypeptidase-like regulatory domain-containing protein, partial [Bermanella sp.]